MTSFAAALLALLAPAAALATPAGPAVDHAWARPTMGAMGMSAVYLDIHGGPAPDRLVSASSPAGELQLHRSTVTGGMAGMAPVASLPVPPRGEVKLAPGGYHLMLSHAARPLKLGDHVAVTLIFEHAGAVKVDAPVLEGPPSR